MYKDSIPHLQLIRVLVLHNPNIISNILLPESTKRGVTKSIAVFPPTYPPCFQRFSKQLKSCVFNTWVNLGITVMAPLVVLTRAFDWYPTWPHRTSCISYKRYSYKFKSLLSVYFHRAPPYFRVKTPSTVQLADNDQFVNLEAVDQN